MIGQKKKTTYVNIMTFYLITWYFSRSNLSWIVINRRSNRLQRKQEHKSDLYFCTCIQRQHQNVMRTTNWHTWGSKVCRCFLPHFLCLQRSTVTVQTHGKCNLFVLYMWSHGPKGNSPFTPKHQYPDSPYSSLYISFGTDKENLFEDQSFLCWWSFPLFSWS